MSIQREKSMEIEIKGRNTSPNIQGIGFSICRLHLSEPAMVNQGLPRTVTKVISEINKIKWNTFLLIFLS